MKRTLALCTFLVFFAGASFAQDARSPRAPMAHQDPMDAHLFPPDLVMKHRRAIELTDQQLEFIRAQAAEAQGRFTTLNWDLEDAVELMHSLVSEARPDEEAMLIHLDKILEIEREIKRAQLMLTVRVKNQLTDAQQAALRELRSQEHP